MSSVDYLIIGQGLAGSILADKLMSRNKSIIVIDDGNKSSSSIVAAGIMNPITGRRFVKSWMYDDLASVATRYYRERFKGLDVLRSMPIYRLLKTAGGENEYVSRSGQQGWSEYMDFSTDTGLDGIRSTSMSMGIIRRAATISILSLMDVIKNELIIKKKYYQEKFQYNLLRYSDQIWFYRDIKANNVIFCEGSKITQNPFFNYLPMVPAKGELLIIRSDRLPTDKIVKGELIIVPLTERLFWVGATYDWEYNHDLPTESNYEYLTVRLNKMLDHRYEIICHSSAVRPTVKDRRPLLGQHFSHPRMYCFNGFGTKGASLIPYFAESFIEYLLQGSPLMAEVNIRRFSPTESGDRTRITC